jgi:hypothetical protein
MRTTVIKFAGGCSPARAGEGRRGLARAWEAPAHASVGENRDRLDLDQERSGQLGPD